MAKVAMIEREKKRARTVAKFSEKRRNLERLVSIAIPRIRDFRGFSPKQFDGRGNFAMGVSEQIIFPEIDYEKVDKLRGMDITITTTARTDDEGRALLRAFNFPLKG